MARGQKTGGRNFQPGQSGNPSGRPKGWIDFQAACRERSPKALKLLEDAVAEGPSAVAIEASKTILAYAWGKPPQPQTGEGGSGPVQIEVTSGVPRGDDRS